MSLWQRAHVSLVMKKFDGMIPPTFVFADEGKNGLRAPAPSSSMREGTSSGFTIRPAARLSERCRTTIAELQAVTATITRAVARTGTVTHFLLVAAIRDCAQRRSSAGVSASRPTNETATCAITTG